MTFLCRSQHLVAHVSLVILIAMTCVSQATGGHELCVVGCTPYVDPFHPFHGVEKYKAMARELADTCDIVVHIGDTKPGETMGCNETIMTRSVHMLVDAGASIVLYAPGDNEVTDCHRLGSAPVGKRYPSDILKASNARQFLIDDLNIGSGFDVTGNHEVYGHNLGTHKNPATCHETGNNCLSYSCDFDKYIEMDHYAVATLEVLGNHWYLDDEREDGYPNQNTVDPLADRLAMYINAKDCALDWISHVTEKAYQAQKRAIFFMLHGKFYVNNGRTARGARSIGEYYKHKNLRSMTSKWNDTVNKPYDPLFEKFIAISQEYKNMSFQIVHSDTHRWFSTRLNPGAHNVGARVRSHHNVMIHQTEGASRALTMYTRFTVDPNKFQPITVKQEWSRDAFDQEPQGHAWKPYKAPYKF